MAKIQTVDNMKEFIAKRTVETWNVRQIPYYLSYVASDLKGQDINYRDFIAPAKLSQWASTTEFNGIKFVSHPTVKAKVGFVPSNIAFAFEDGAAPKQSNVSAKPAGRRGRALLQFVEALAKLPDDALVDLHIPATVLTALMRQQ